MVPAGFQRRGINSVDLTAKRIETEVIAVVIHVVVKGAEFAPGKKHRTIRVLGGTVVVHV